MALRRDRFVGPVRVGAMVGVVLLALAFLFPVLAGPVTGDDRYWYLAMGADPSWSPAHEITRLPSALGERVENGRANVVTELERRVNARLLTNVAVATGTPVTVYVSALKLGLAVLIFACAGAMIRSLRWREADGRLVRASRRSVRLAVAAGVLTVAVGARPQTARLNGLNGWTSYPLTTYGAAIAIFACVALVLWLARTIAERDRAVRATAVVLLVLVGVATNFHTELAFPAVPLAVIALLVVPVTSRALQREGRRAKLVAGGAFLGGFLPVFVVIRVLIERSCDSGGECYRGVRPELGPELVRTAAYNLISTIPGTGVDELRTSVAVAGIPGEIPVGPTTWSILVGGAVVLVLATLWSSPREDPPNDTETSTDVASARAESTMLAVGAGLFLLAAVGAAAVMALSGFAQLLIHDPGIPYRNAVVTWTGIAFAVTLAVLAVARRVRPRADLAVWTAFAVLIGALGATSLPSTMMALRANRSLNQASESIAAEVVRGDLDPGGDDRRCALLLQMRSDGGLGLGPAGRARMVAHADAAFRRYHGRSFCSDEEVVARAVRSWTNR